jgi:hypothetical protein
MNLLYELGGIDEYTRLVLREKVKDILLEDALDEPKEYFKTNGQIVNNLDGSFNPNLSFPKLGEESLINGDGNKG